MYRKAVSIKDISTMAGVSIATVSRVINNTGNYSRETENRVREILLKTHYHPNMIAKGLRTSRLQSIGVIVPDITNEFFAKIIRELQTRLFASSYATVICNTNESRDMEKKHLQLLQAQHVSGLIYINGGTTEETNEFPDLPTVYIDRRPILGLDDRNAVIIESDNFAGGSLAAGYLLEAGCHRIAVFTERLSISTQQQRFAGFEQELMIRGLPSDPRLHLQAESGNACSARRQMESFLASEVPFDGIFCATDRLALGAVSALNAHGIDVPGKVKVVGFDDISISQLYATPITTIHQSVDRMGKTAAEMILKLLGGEKISQSHVVLPVYLVRRTTA